MSQVKAVTTQFTPTWVCLGRLQSGALISVPSLLTSLHSLRSVVSILRPVVPRWRRPPALMDPRLGTCRHSRSAFSGPTSPFTTSTPHITLEAPPGRGLADEHRIWRGQDRTRCEGEPEFRVPG
ncbi:unnamed protein product [Arctogadus glacialis]